MGAWLSVPIGTYESELWDEDVPPAYKAVFPPPGRRSFQYSPPYSHHEVAKAKMSGTHLEYMDPSTAAALLKGPERPSVLVLDVRDDDFTHLGHIVGCVNIPAGEFATDYGVANFLDGEHLQNGKITKILVHCWMSQQRGPTVARILAQALAARGQTLPEVMVLERGFRYFGRNYIDDPCLVTPSETPF